MLTVPKILPNEFAPAYAKTIARFNHPKPRDGKGTHLLGTLGKWYLGKISMQDLALIGGMGSRELVNEHTLQHILRALMMPNRKPWGAIDDSTYASLPLMHSARQQAFMCLGCVEDDIDRFGRSYWHADHQIPGIYKCPIHSRTPLRAVEIWNHLEFWHTPGQAHIKSFVQADWLAWTRNEAIRRYVKIALFMARWEGNVTWHDISALFRSKLNGLGISHRALPHYVMSKIPEAWLQNLVIPGKCAVTSPTQCLSCLTDTTATLRPRRLFVYVGAAALWPTASEGIEALRALNIHT